MYNLELFGKRLREARQQKNLTQGALAELVGISTQSVSKYEQCDGNTGNKPTLDTAVAIAAALDVSLDWLCNLNTGERVKTPVDVARAIVYISDAAEAVDVQEIEDMSSPDFGTVLLDEARLVFTFNNEELAGFLLDWVKVKQLSDTGVLPGNLYELWLENEYKKLETPPWE